ncbi:hypothetical protein JOL62DRAFT_561893 [Phyllosticta paracitricarpa]|uniref:Secreted protein n=1 Tax=Phyllosticta paracitricarpa TaxID=2016321 RepID=A0ABR1NLK3_9PEZI
MGKSFLHIYAWLWGWFCVRMRSPTAFSDPLGWTFCCYRVFLVCLCQHVAELMGFQASFGGMISSCKNTSHRWWIFCRFGNWRLLTNLVSSKGGMVQNFDMDFQQPIHVTTTG